VHSEHHFLSLSIITQNLIQITSKLVITMKKVNNVGDGEGTIWFDEFVVTHGAGKPAAAANPVASSAAPLSSTASVVASSPTPSSSSGTKHQTAKAADSSASSKPSASAAAAPAAAKSNNTGAIVAAVLVSLFLILALVGFFLFWRNRKKRRLEKLALLGEKPGFDYTGPRTYASCSRSIQIFTYAPHLAPIPYNSAPAGTTTPQSAYPFLTNAVGSNGNVPFNPYSPESINPPPSLPPIRPASNYAPSTTVASPTAASPRRESVGSTAAFSSIANFMMGTAVPSERSPSPSIAGGSSIAGGRVLPSNFGDSAVELKQRAKAALLAEQNQLQQQYPIQHVDSGVRAYGIANPGEEQLPMELPPVYSAN
jgi:hypothetical protein